MNLYNIRYVSRFKRVLSQYNTIRARLFNSHALLERTNLMLFNINEAGITRVELKATYTNLHVYTTKLL